VLHAAGSARVVTAERPRAQVRTCSARRPRRCTCYDATVALDPLLVSIVLDSLRRVGREIDARVAADQAYKREHPCDAAVFHGTFAASLPWWQFPRRWWHRDQERRWGAWCSAEERRSCSEDSQRAGRVARVLKADAKRERKAIAQRRRAADRAVKAVAKSMRGPDDSGPAA